MTIAPATPAPATPSIPIPDSHRDLLERPLVGVLTTIGADGQPQSSLVWLDFDGTAACVGTTAERQKGRNLRLNDKVSLLVVDPENTSRFIQIRGAAELDAQGAVAHLDSLTRKYTSYPRYYGYMYPEEQRARERRLIVRIRARRITLDAIHN